jgi:hypothetical protein
MNINIINKRKLKRSFSNGLFIKAERMLPWAKRHFIQLGFFGIIISLKYGRYE